MTRDDLVGVLRARDPLAAARRITPVRVVTWTRGDETLTAAAVPYGTEVSPEETADHLLALAARSHGEVRAVCPTPGAGSPGSWGVQDLAVIAASRLALPDVEWIRPSWTALGPALCQIAVAFGANDWVIPDGDRTDPDLLAAAVGCRAVAR